MKKSENTVKKNCVFYKDDKSCEKLQPERNCYQCDLTRVKMLESDVNNYKKRLYAAEENNETLEEENKKLKIMLAENYLLKYEGTV